MRVLSSVSVGRALENLSSRENQPPLSSPVSLLVLAVLPLCTGFKAGFELFLIFVGYSRFTVCHHFLLPFFTVLSSFIHFLLDLWGLHRGLSREITLETGRITGINENNGENSPVTPCIAQGLEHS